MIVWIDDVFSKKPDESVVYRTLRYLRDNLRSSVEIKTIGNVEELEPFLRAIMEGQINPHETLVICDHNLRFLNYTYGSEVAAAIMRKNRSMLGVPIVVYTDDPFNAYINWSSRVREEFLGGNETPLHNAIVTKYKEKDEREPQELLLEAINEYRPEFILPNEGEEGTVGQT